MTVTETTQVIAIIQTERAFLLKNEPWPRVKPQIDALTTQINHLLQFLK
jgi:hypothetical protein